MDKKVEELESIEQEDDDSDDDSYVDSLRKEVGEEMTKVKSTLASHTEFSNNIQLMCGYMMQTRDNIPQAGKIISDAKIAFDKSEKDEQIIEKKVNDWMAKNKKWLRGKRKEKKKESGAKTTEKESNTRWLETFAKELKPEGNLKNDGDLTAMRAFKQSMIRYTNYIKKNNFEMGPELYFDMNDIKHKWGPNVSVYTNM